METKPNSDANARTKSSRVADVRRLLEAAKRIASERSPSLVASIAESTGLSLAGVELALGSHLEVDATDDEIGQLVDYAGDAERVVVILSSNVFVGALRAIAIARAASSRVVVRPSRRDPAFAKALVASAGDPAIVIDDDFDVATTGRGDEVHVYGRDETIADVRARVTAARVRGHGAGMGIAWIATTSAGDRAAAARALAADVVVFDQRGCLSPRVALVEGDGDAADAFAEALHAELERLDVAVPRGQLPAEERAASDRYVATMTYACRALVGTHHAIGIAPPGAPIVASPAYRHVHVAACLSLEAASAAIAPMRRAIVAVGSNDERQAKLLAPPWARLSPLGQMQKPRLDGPVDRRPDDGRVSAD